MPTLYQLPPNIRWGDLLMTEDGGVFSVDASGFLKLSYGPPYRVDTNSTYSGNDDGKEDSCVPIALRHLGLEPPAESLSNSQLDKRLSKFERIVPLGTAADFIRDHQSGRFLISVYYNDSGHAFALLDGEARNLTFESLHRGVRVAYRIT
jgi:hypothetical protein